MKEYFKALAIFFADGTAATNDDEEERFHVEFQSLFYWWRWRGTWLMFTRHNNLGRNAADHFTSSSPWVSCIPTWKWFLCLLSHSKNDNNLLKPKLMMFSLLPALFCALWFNSAQIYAALSNKIFVCPFEMCECVVFFPSILFCSFICVPKAMRLHGIYCEAKNAKCCFGIRLL